MSLVDEAIERLRALPPTDRESAAESLIMIVERYEAPPRLTPEQIEQVKRLEADLDAGRLEVLSDEESEEMWRRLGA